MSNVYNVFNTTSEHEFSRFLDKLDLTTNELINLTYIAENNTLSLNDRRTKILELMAGSSDGNYELCVEQFNKSHKQRVLKESSQLNLNQIMELNDLVCIVANKLSAPNCMKGLYNIIKGKLGSEVANTFLGMVQQSSVNDSNLKFNTDLQVNDKNLADMIYQIKNEIEMFTNSVECEKEEVNESVDGYSIENRLAGVYNIKNGSFRELANGEQHNLSEQDFKNRLVRYGFQDTKDGKICYITAWSYADAFNTKGALTKKYPNENVEKWRLEWFQNGDGSWNKPLKKYVEVIGKNGQELTESYSKYKQVVDEISKVLDDVSNINVLKTVSQKVDELFKKVKNMNEANQIAELKSKIETKLGSLTDTKPQIEECVAQQVVSSVCEDDTFNGLLQSLRPTVINITVNKEGDMDETICNPSETLKALASHINCQKSDCAENNLEELQTVNTLLSSLSNYFEATLTESVDLSKDEVTQNDLRIIDEYDIRPSKEWKIKDISRSFHVESYAVNKYGHVIFNIEYIGEDHTGINWGIITADSFDEMMKDGRLTCLTPSEEEWDGEDDEELMENNNVLPSGTYNIIVSNIEVDDYEEGEYNIHGEKELTINHEINNDLDEEIKEAILEDMGEPINGSIKVIDYDYQIVDKNNKGKLEEDTVYDHSWYEVKKQKYPKRTKDGVIGLPIEETASVGATCAGSVSGFAKPLGSKPKKRKKSTIELDMFKESVQNGLHSALEINGKMVAYRIFEGKGYLYIDNAILKATNKEAILEAIDDIYNDCLETPVLEGFTPYQLEILMEDDMNTNTIITPEEKKEQQDELDSQIQLNPNLKVGYTDENSSNVEDNQELVGVDDSDMNNKKYVVRDPQSGKVKVANASQIKVIGN